MVRSYCSLWDGSSGQVAIICPWGSWSHFFDLFDSSLNEKCRNRREKIGDEIPRFLKCSLEICQERWKDIIVALGLQMIWTLLQLHFSWILMLSWVQGKKVHQVHFALDVARCLNLDAVHVVETFVEEGVQVAVEMHFEWTVLFWIWSSILRWNPGCPCSALEVINPGCDDDLLQKSSWDVQSFLAFPHEPKWI